MRSALRPLLLLSAAVLLGCNFDALEVGGPPDAAAKPLTEDEQLAYYGSLLAGTWRGLTSVETLLLQEQVWLNMEWTPSPESVRTGEVRVRCVADGTDCTPAAGMGGFRLGYSLYDVADPREVRGVFEFKDEKGEVQGLGTLELSFIDATELTLFSSGGGPFIPFVTLYGTFKKDLLAPPDAGVDAGPSLGAPNP